MIKVEAIKKVTATEQIMEQIAQSIISGELAAGEKLPNERLLAEQFGVARGRIREALRALSLIGLIHIKAGEGSFVKKQDEPISSETITWLFHNEIHHLDEVYAARKLIESEVYLTAAKEVKEPHFEELETILADLKEVRQKNDPEAFQKLLDRFDIFIGEICGNNIYYKLMQTVIHLRRETSIKLLLVPGAQTQSIENRTRLLLALRSGDVKQVQEASDYSFNRSKPFYKSIMDR
ncbi:MULTISPECIES: GntR family transcriptional regulator [unclassified Paenibacillus]|uniref:FadR/GntR family transcriptional regulator n=1 Tax=unclassified Paenibacillus TaxID=185978 RepID=UPI001AE7F418|nr:MULTISPECIES: GntR family transcriptional regulator [unclassified Paenibacillus]MBP1156731.1 DNA-binding FadR family transcriptional regulator [Paenibacillus sp. PvP091]MBP1172531.1 DNA-binding FadR family transcriptional regulator [Paenibacillus sp. PvR098]MBP2438911.1 DNA-binding FadR family transcriptional regulator [Paenibacillus sp. PvP052]